MKKSFAFVIAATLSAALEAATVSNVEVKQNWPWSTDVTVTYTLSNVSGPTDVEVSAKTGDTAVDSYKLRNAITGRRYGITANGNYSFTIDVRAALGYFGVSGLGDFTVTLTTVDDTEEKLNQVLYRKYNLVDNTMTEITRRELLNGDYGRVATSFAEIGEGFTTDETDPILIWTGVVDDPMNYTTNLVLRYINATNRVWKVGQCDADGKDTHTASGYGNFYAKLTENFYIGVFPITVEQQRLIMGESSPKYNPATSHKPFNHYAWSKIRGNRYLSTSQCRISGEAVYWPTNVPLHDVAKKNNYGKYFMDELRQMFVNSGYAEFDVPTLSQWDFASRGGTKGTLYSGKALSEANANELGWLTTNSDSVEHDVGQKLPNAYGLYDMLGNVREPVNDLWNTFDQTTHGSTEADPRVDATGGRGSDVNTQITTIGGYCKSKYTALRSGQNVVWYENVTNLGYRVVIPDTSDGKWKQTKAVLD